MANDAEHQRNLAIDWLGEADMNDNDETRKKGSTDLGLRTILIVTRGRTFFFFARFRSLAAARRVRVADRPAAKAA